ncbi:MAG: DHA2 family efflux MFS transporter permease subunit [Nevskiaceae bacterium]|nr:MAG: DHA2 family efflux MFS transporter permease subunit [Nevskiaceae bacterium]
MSASVQKASQAPLKGLPLVLLTVGVALSTFMEVLDTTIVNVSVPNIAGSLAVSPSEGTWAISSYSLAAAIMQPLTGWLSKRFGEVRTFCLSVLLFVVFSALCGLATTMPMLVLFRLMQGLVSGPMVPLSQSLLMVNYPPEKRGIALGLWAMTVIVAPVFGPIFGGWLTDNLSWPWIFYINLPVGLFAAIITWTLMRKRETPMIKNPIDVVGLFLLVVGVGSLQFMLDNGNDLDWFGSPVIVALGLTALVGLIFLVAWELTDRHPIVDLSLFRQRNYRFGVMAMGLGIFGFFGISVIFPLWLQTTVGYTATWAGLATAPVGILPLILAPIVGKNVNRLNLRAATSFAFFIFAVSSFWAATRTDSSSYLQYALPRFFQGVGIAFFFVPINQIIMSGVQPHEIASASGLSNFVRTIAGSLSTAISTWLWQDRSTYHRTVLAEHVNAQAPGWQHYQAQLQSTVGGDVSHWQPLLDHVVAVQAQTMAANDMFRLYGVIFLIIIPILWLARPPFGARGIEGMH